MPRINSATKNTKFGRDLIGAFKEVLAHQRGEIELPVIDYGPRKRNSRATKRMSKKKR